MELVFVYNAFSDTFHKLVSPQIYSCNLCTLTCSSVRMRPAWQEYIGGLELPFRSLHAGELGPGYAR